MQVLIVEDEPMLREGLLDLMRGAGHQAVAVADGLSAVESATREPFELVLLDLMLPGIDGIEVCRRLRMTRPALPILMLTARGAEDDKVAGLQAGADDYLTKPFSARELLARVEAMARRARLNPPAPERLEVAGLLLDLSRCTCQRGDEILPLTPREVGILRYLHRHRSRAVPRGELLEQVWGMRGDLETRTVDMTIANLRQKLEHNPSNPQLVVTLKGIGYAWGPGTEGEGDGDTRLPGRDAEAKGLSASSRPSGARAELDNPASHSGARDASERDRT